MINSGGLVGELNLSFAAGIGLDNFGLDSLNVNVNMSGSLSIIFNTTQSELEYAVPSIFCGSLAG